MLPTGAPKPGMPGGTLSYSNKTKPSAYANQSVYPTYAFKSYESYPPYLGERSGHYSVVTQQPFDKRMAAPDLNDVFTPSDPQMEELTSYYLNRVPAEQKSINAVLTIKEYGLQDLLTKFIRGKLQEDADMVKARYAGATQVESDLAQARLQNRYSDMIRYYGGEQRLREALLRDYVGGLPEASLRASATNALQREMAEGGAGPFAVDAAGPQPVGAMDAGAMAADAEAGQLDEMDEREPDVSVTTSMADRVMEAQAQLRQLYLEKADLEEELGQLEYDIQDAETPDDIQEAEAQQALIRQQIDEIDEQLGQLEKDSSQVQPTGGMVAGDATGDSATEYAPVEGADDGAAVYAPGAASGSQYAAMPAVGGMGGMGREMPSRGPGGSSSRAMVGELIGHQASAAPAAAMATQDPAAAGASARQDAMSSRQRRQHRARAALQRQIFGEDVAAAAAAAEEPVSTHQQGMGLVDTRRQRRR